MYLQLMKSVLVTLGAVAIGVAAIAAANADGKSIFVASKCATCHTISKVGVTGGTSGDLSKVGTKHNAAFLEKYLTKTEAVNGKKHPKKWSGSDADLKVLAAWLASLK